MSSVKFYLQNKNKNSIYYMFSVLKSPSPATSLVRKRHINSPEYWLIPGSGGTVPNMTEKLLNGMLNLNKHTLDTQVNECLISAEKSLFELQDKF